MNIETRKKEIITTLASCSKASYTKEELLSEMLNLQQEMLEATFNKNHAELADLRLWDIERHFEQINDECNGIATEEIERFKLQSKTVCNLIKAEFSGNRGESKAFKTLEFLKTPHTILKNVEFNDENGRTELDAVVITPSGITIVEVKNTSKDIFIDEQGNYYRTGQFLRLDCNIASKMSAREDILRQTLSKIGFDDTKIQSVLVFTNSRIEVQNKYNGINVCFNGQLNYYIENLSSTAIYTEEEIAAMASHITESSNRNQFTLDFDADQFKNDFATVMAILENAASQAASKELEITEDLEQPVIKQESFREKIIKALHSDAIKKAGGIAAALSVSIISSVITKKIVLNGGAK